jgi:hypothetical protein
MVFSSDLFPSGSRNEILNTLLVPLMYDSCPLYLNVLDLIIRKVLDE